MVAAAEPRRPIGHSKDRFDLGVCQKIHFSLVVSFARYCEHALDKGAVSRLLEGHKPKERADGSQAQVACRDADAAIRLKIAQERADERRVELIERQGRWCFVKPHLRKHEQQAERVPVGSDRMDANVALTHEPFGKVALDQRCHIAAGLHGLASQCRSRRCAASCINSGHAERYQ